METASLTFTIKKVLMLLIGQLKLSIAPTVVRKEGTDTARCSPAIMSVVMSAFVVSQMAFAHCAASQPESFARVSP
jgi:hypothetical protein